jgi:hypothetical protein
MALFWADVHQRLAGGFSSRRSTPPRPDQNPGGWGLSTCGLSGDVRCGTEAFQDSDAASRGVSWGTWASCRSTTTFEEDGQGRIIAVSVTCQHISEARILARLLLLPPVSVSSRTWASCRSTAARRSGGCPGACHLGMVRSISDHSDPWISSIWGIYIESSFWLHIPNNCVISEQYLEVRYRFFGPYLECHRCVMVTCQHIVA